jgi:hypothetical protein
MLALENIRLMLVKLHSNSMSRKPTVGGEENMDHDE